MKRAYETPTACAEKFMSNEYVAVCWYIACDYGQGENNHYDPQRGYHDRYSNGTGCGWADNQVINERNDGTFTIREADGFGEDYQMQMTRNGNWDNLQWTLSDVTEGETGVVNICAVFKPTKLSSFC